MEAVAINGPILMKVLYSIEPYSIHHGEVSEAIAQAANQDPLFPGRVDGCLRTAAILIALAWYGSRFQPTLVGENGKAFGLYQIRPPATNALGRVITTNMLTNPRDASLVAIDLARQSFMKGEGKGWEERLTHFCMTDDQERGVALKKGLTRMLLADKIVRDHFGDYAMLPKPTTDEARRLGP